MFKDSTVLSEKIFFQASKLFLRIFGVWPEDNYLQRKYLIRQIIPAFVSVSSALGGFAFIYENIKTDIKVTIETMCPLACLVECTIKLFVLLAFNKKLVKLIQGIRLAWFSGKIPYIFLGTQTYCENLRSRHLHLPLKNICKMFTFPTQVIY